MSKNAELLESFTTYCAAHPSERFWQALRNWAGARFIYTSNHPYNDGDDDALCDTFNWTRKDGR